MRDSLAAVLDAHAHPDVRRRRRLAAYGVRRKSRISDERLVSTWNVCQCACSIMSKTRVDELDGTSSWNRSLIELTKIIRGFRQLQRLLEPLGPERQVEAVSRSGWPGMPRKRSAKRSA